MYLLKFILFVLLFKLWYLLDVVHAEPVIVMDLNKEWTLENQNGTIKKNKILTIPSGVYSALYDNEVLHSYNDVEMRWIAKDNWTYSLTFPVEPSYLERARFCNLTFHGIDTISEITLNNRILGQTDNMFVRYSYNVTDILRVTDNVLEVKLMSPIYAALNKASELRDQNLEVPPDCPNERYNGECHMNLLRKMQASFSWDWGPAVPSMGLWKPVFIEFYEVALIRDVDVIITKGETDWNLKFRVYMDCGSVVNFYGELVLYMVELLSTPVVINKHKDQPISFRNPVIEFEQSIPIEQVELWWPNGYGQQKLYPLHFTLTTWLDPKGPSTLIKTVSNKAIHVGFRTIELVENKVTEGDGNTFLFKVNGQEIFMKGTNYIPPHILPEYATRDTQRIKHLLKSAKEAHFNMIRVWGGGFYESDLFYELADTYGILIWQDMMFACAMYPVTPDFLNSVRQEVVQNAKRLAYHASIAIFATNNENEVALAQNWYKTKDDEIRFNREYRELYLGNVKHELKIISDSSRPEPLVSSPSNGKEGANDEYLSPDPQNPNYGDVHFYDILKDAWDASIYPQPRFASEYGFQSLPKRTSWLRSMKKEDDLLELITHRQHHPLGINVITVLVRRHLPLPLQDDDNYTDGLIYFSQIEQAMATKVQTELYRSLRDTEHRTMGALYWQLNDVWVAPSWSSIDYYGNYKILHHWAKDFMAPISIVALYDSQSKTVNVSIICDSIAIDENSRWDVQLSHYIWSDMEEAAFTNWETTVKPNGVHYDKVFPMEYFLADKFNATNSFAEFALMRNDEIISKTYYFPASIKAAVGMKDPEVKVDIVSNLCHSQNDRFIQNYSISITVKNPAIFLYLEIQHEKITQYKLSQNGFMQFVPRQTIYLEIEHSECIYITRANIKFLTVNQFMLKS